MALSRATTMYSNAREDELGSLEGSVIFKEQQQEPLAASAGPMKVFTYASPSVLKQARKEHLQARIQERIQARLAAQKERYAGLESHANTDVVTRQDQTQNSVQPDTDSTAVKGGSEQYQTLVVPPSTMHSGRQHKEGKLIVMGQSQEFQRNPMQYTAAGMTAGPAKVASVQFSLRSDDVDTEAGTDSKSVSKAASKPDQQTSRATGSPLRSRGVNSKAPLETAVSQPDTSAILTLKQSVTMPYVPIQALSTIVPPKGMGTTGQVIKSVRASLEGVIIKPIISHAPTTAHARTVQSGDNAAHDVNHIHHLVRSSYAGGLDLSAAVPGMGSDAGLISPRDAGSANAAASSALSVKVQEEDCQAVYRKQSNDKILNHAGIATGSHHTRQSSAAGSRDTHSAMSTPRSRGNDSSPARNSSRAGRAAREAVEQVAASMVTSMMLAMQQTSSNLQSLSRQATSKDLKSDSDKDQKLNRSDSTVPKSSTSVAGSASQSNHTDGKVNVASHTTRPMTTLSQSTTVIHDKEQQPGKAPIGNSATTAAGIESDNNGPVGSSCPTPQSCFVNAVVHTSHVIASRSCEQKQPPAGQPTEQQQGCGSQFLTNNPDLMRTVTQSMACTHNLGPSEARHHMNNTRRSLVASGAPMTLASYAWQDRGPQHRPFSSPARKGNKTDSTPTNRTFYVQGRSLAGKTMQQAHMSVQRSSTPPCSTAVPTHKTMSKDRNGALAWPLPSGTDIHVGNTQMATTTHTPAYAQPVLVQRAHSSCGFYTQDSIQTKSPPLRPCSASHAMRTTATVEQRLADQVAEARADLQYKVLEIKASQQGFENPGDMLLSQQSVTDNGHGNIMLTPAGAKFLKVPMPTSKVDSRASKAVAGSYGSLQGNNNVTTSPEKDLLSRKVALNSKCIALPNGGTSHPRPQSANASPSQANHYQRPWSAVPLNANGLPVKRTRPPSAGSWAGLPHRASFTAVQDDAYRI